MLKRSNVLHIEAGIQMGFTTLVDSQWDCKKRRKSKILKLNFKDFFDQ